jgi:hypothetical protein
MDLLTDCLDLQMGNWVLFLLFPDRVIGSNGFKISDHALIKGMDGDGRAVANDD